MDTHLLELKSWFTRYVNSFYTGEPDVQKNIALKAEHTHRVCENILEIGKSLGISSPELVIAETAALLHDIGRFEQYHRYRTFADSRSENHASLGVKIIQQNNLLQGFDAVVAGAIIRAVACHNRLEIPAQGDQIFLRTLKMLRDADKLDIWRVVIDYYRNSAGERNQAVELGLPDTDDISETIYQGLMAGRPVRFADLQVLNDFKLLQMGWIYDLNYQKSFDLVGRRGYLEAIRDTLPQGSRKVQELYEKIRGYLEKRMQETR
ncbi:HD domain-containing protein [Desulfobulbus rhabdoformis]|uniref:HD domain-containing protein n=1 Tax=Desulfobulbus rhabdoformis TaxID=34032 RepID=UPI0019661096|nr:HD domain-containing protein [Desulfobulbus rhabdoformis]MBM9614838.1 HD domain-containing protein [Desulfobulbus rhabdoformis]